MAQWRFGFERSQKVIRKKQGNKVSPRNDKEDLQKLAELDAIAESSRKPQRGESSLDPIDEEP